MSYVIFCIYIFLLEKKKQTQKFVKSQNFSFRTDYFEQDIRRTADTRGTKILKLTFSQL